MPTHSPTIGTISHATLRPQDLIPAFRDAICATNTGDYDEALSHLFTILPATDDDPWWNSEEAQDFINTMSDILNDHAPPYLYFGAHVGDGSDFGFWPDHDQIRDDIHDGTLLKVNDTSEIPPNHPTPVLHVNDYGNMTLYVPTTTHTELWSIV